ncbi:hypothetical protein MUO74_10480 [Candidatus Bathyarchaeota archaeon]|nr:hypothetical protein [Candidatus Bathyarchaeota archaeon]
MVESEKNYSDYIKHISNVISALALFSGFMFTAITVLVTRLPDLDSVPSQLMLFVAAFFLDIFMFLFGNFIFIPAQYCKMPPLTRRYDKLNLLTFASATLAMGILTAGIFFVYHLTYLALAQLAVSVMLSLALYVYTIRPFLEYRKTHNEEST